MSLSTKQLAHLKGLAHDKKPVILLGHKGLTDAVVKETAAALLSHELIKVRLHGEDRDALAVDAERIAADTKSTLVDAVGKIVILYKRHPDTPKIVLPRE
jgi:RNA-binding protein